MQVFAFITLASLATALPGYVEKRQGVTHAIAPTGGFPPTCTGTLKGRFGIAVEAIGGPKLRVRQAVHQIDDGQVISPTGLPKPLPVAIVEILTQINDGQIQNAPQPTPTVVSQINDGQVQAALATPCPKQAISPAAPPSTVPKPSVANNGSIPLHKPNSMPSNSTMTPKFSGTVCNANFAVTLDGGVLLDKLGRTGYIASNRQFQFDKPAQSEAIFTAGFSVCSDGRLALGGSKIFYQCLSGDFYNLYDENFAPQCEAIHIELLPDVCS